MGGSGLGFSNVLAQIAWVPFWFSFVHQAAVQWIAAADNSRYWLPVRAASVCRRRFRLSGGSQSRWPSLTGFAAHWEKNANFATGFDQWFLNLFPREKPYVFNPGGYQTLNFVPSLATMIFGLLAGGLLRSERPLPQKVARLALFGCAGVVFGLVISLLGLCPIVKRIWTPSWAIYSGGWVTLMLAGFVSLIDWAGWKRWAFPCIVAGLNPITLYCLWQLTPSFFRDTFRTHLGRGVFEVFGSAYAPIVQHLSVLLAFWLFLFWMHRRKVFIRI